eukprot:gnl/TRDRNA2_/TRDRNA2_162583_c2_seq1.p1 gnl/TRDRNA2_/TRDRNA2_162583_c2~~gnl/TRDRNA2_/TRDRNA2_162583_c2_seq1.p1  ORF type:complete len:121 (+),score=44.02 gnl/TRDRNA2_/TRDRNA2_162583_c2_seq1:332-694(+)
MYNPHLGMPALPAMMMNPAALQAAMAQAAAAAQGARPPLPPAQPALTKEALAALAPQQQKQALGERLFPVIARLKPQLASKITGMMLELSNEEILNLLASEPHLLQKVNEAVSVLERQQR